MTTSQQLRRSYAIQEIRQTATRQDIANAGTAHGLPTAMVDKLLKSEHSHTFPVSWSIARYLRDAAINRQQNSTEGILEQQMHNASFE